MDRWYKDALEVGSFGNLIDKTAGRWGSNTFYVGEDGTHITYREFKEKVDSFAKGLLSLGVRKGDKVGLWMTNRAEWVISEFATYKTGATLVPIYTYFKLPEVEYVLKQANVNTLIMTDAFLKGRIDALRILKTCCPEVDQLSADQFKSLRFPDLQRIIVLHGEKIKGRYDYSELLDRGVTPKLDEELSKAQEAVSPFDLAKIQFTSGTTGFPKGGMHRHITNLCCWSLAFQRFGLHEKSVFLQNMPIFTNWGCFVTGGAILCGATMVDTGEFHTNPELSLQAIEREKVTWLSATTAQLIDLFNHTRINNYDLCSLQQIWYAGTLPKEVKDSLRVRRIEPMTGWGMSEVGGQGIDTLPTDSFEVRTETLGLPLPCVRLKVVEWETGKRVIDKAGELLIREVYPGSAGFYGYWNMPTESAELVTGDGWFKTGDLMVEREDGYFCWAGRSKDMLKVGGFNVYPAEVERALREHPNIREVVVIGVPDKRLEEVAMAWICPHEGMKIAAEEVISFAKEHLPSYAVPRYIRFYKHGELPLSTTGKIQKHKLAEIACKELNLREQQ